MCYWGSGKEILNHTSQLSKRAPKSKSWYKYFSQFTCGSARAADIFLTKVILLNKLASEMGINIFDLPFLVWVSLSRFVSSLVRNFNLCHYFYSIQDLTLLLMNLKFKVILLVKVKVFHQGEIVRSYNHVTLWHSVSHNNNKTQLELA